MRRSAVEYGILSHRRHTAVMASLVEPEPRLRVDVALAWLYAAFVAALVLVPFSTIAQLVAPIVWVSIVLRVSSKRDRGVSPTRSECERA